MNPILMSVIINRIDLYKSLKNLRNILREVLGIRQNTKSTSLSIMMSSLAPFWHIFRPFDHICEVPINQKPGLSLSSDFLCFFLIRSQLSWSGNISMTKGHLLGSLTNISEVTNSTKRYSMINLYPSPHSSAGHFIFREIN